MEVIDFDPFCLQIHLAFVSMYADDSTIYASATTANEVTETLNKELQSVLEWVASNKLVMNGVAVEQVETWRYLRLNLYVFTMTVYNGCKDGERSSRNKEMLCFFDTTHQK